MSILTYLTQADIRDNIQTVEGEMLTRPSLIKTDGTNLTYAADVKISGFSDPLRNVPIAMGNRDLIYADAGQAVTLTRNTTGRFEITGFAKTKPGLRWRVPVDLNTLMSGDGEDVTLTTYRLTLADLADPRFGGGFGVIPFGSYAVMRGAIIIEVRA